MSKAPAHSGEHSTGVDKNAAHNRLCYTAIQLYRLAEPVVKVTNMLDKLHASSSLEQQPAVTSEPHSGVTALLVQACMQLLDAS